MKAIRDEIQICSVRAGLKPQVLERSSGIIIRLSAPMPGTDLLSMYVPLSGHDGLVQVERWRQQDQRDLADFFRVDWYRSWITDQDGEFLLECDDRENGQGFHFSLDANPHGCRGTGNWPFTFDSSTQTIEDAANGMPPQPMLSEARPLVVFVSSPLGTSNDRLNRRQVLEVIGSRNPHMIALSLDDLSHFDQNLAFDKICLADTLILVVTSRLTPQTLREWAWAKVCDKQTLPLIHTNISTDASIAQAFIVPYATQVFHEGNLKEFVNRWLDLCLANRQQRVERDFKAFVESARGETTSPSFAE